MLSKGNFRDLMPLGRSAIGVLAMGGCLFAPTLAQAQGSAHEATHVVQQGQGSASSARGVEKSDIRRGHTRGAAAAATDPSPDSDGDGLPDAANRKGGFKAGKALAETVKRSAQPGSHAHAGNGSNPQTGKEIKDASSQVAGDPIPGIDITVNQAPGS